MKKIGVILSWMRRLLTVLEIHEAVLTLLAISRSGCRRSALHRISSRLMLSTI